MASSATSHEGLGQESVSSATNDVQSTDSDEEGSTLPLKRRRKRPFLNCAECRRLKLKCDRQVPCANCIKRECTDICPGGARIAQKKIERYIAALEEAIQRYGLPLPQRPESLSSIGTPESSTTLTGNAASPVNQVLPSAAFYEGTADTNAVMNGRLWTRDQNANIAGHGSTPITDIHSANEGNARRRSSGDELSLGTLMIGDDGRSKYLGPTAASEWLHDQEMLETAPTSPRASTSDLPSQAEHQSTHRHPGLVTVDTFPFSNGHQLSSTAELLAALPLEEDAQIQLESFHRYLGWSYSLVSRQTLQRIMAEIYATRKAWTAYSETHVNLQELALLFMALANGALHNLELSPDDQLSDEYVCRARQCLVQDSFMSKNTIAGVQSINLMAHYHLETESGRNGDSAWPLWGLAMRMGQAMGLHRDGEKWGLPSELVEERRQVFWQTFSAEVFQSNCFSRPCSMSSRFVDTIYPLEAQQGSAHDRFKFDLSRISERALTLSLRLDKPSFGEANALYHELARFEVDLPKHLRCRASMLALTSLYPDASTALAESLELNKRDLKLALEVSLLSLFPLTILQQHSLSFTISETAAYIYRPYFLQALSRWPQDPTRSPYARAVLSILERSNAILQVAHTLLDLNTLVVSRYWPICYHSFNCAVYMGTFILVSPTNEFATVAFAMIDQAIDIYTRVMRVRTAHRFTRNLRWILRLRARCQLRMGAPAETPHGPTTDYETLPSADEQKNVDMDHDAGLLGWKTRLVHRARIRTSRTTSSPSFAQPISDRQLDELLATLPEIQNNDAGWNWTGPLSLRPDQTAAGSEGEGFSPLNQNSIGNNLAGSTDTLLHRFWEPIAFADPGGAAVDEPAMGWLSSLLNEPAVE
ncbi:hypothetical protein IAR55_000708 [Kwoniella newhampshirensis]|uniref:Zn(2)-C6 fungal-type domain-containing protein n=1 Tax=Kwoniella newhampshirensis TaxID=1651941 RepID=A0AAW0Z7C0_9TREE